MHVVDTHTHTWTDATADLPWTYPEVASHWEYDGIYGHEDLLADMDEAGVASAVVVTPSLYGYSQAANAYTYQGLAAYPERLAGVGLVDCSSSEPDHIAAEVRSVLERTGMVGIRFFTTTDAPFVHGTATDWTLDRSRSTEWLLEDAYRGAWQELATSGGFAQFLTVPEHLQGLVELADSQPSLPIIIDHLGWPDDPFAEVSSDLSALGERPNVYVKVSGIPRFSTAGWPYPDLAPLIRQLLEWFGRNRLLFGSDYPAIAGTADYVDCVSWLAEHEYLSDPERRAIAGGTFLDLIGR